MLFNIMTYTGALHVGIQRRVRTRIFPDRERIRLRANTDPDTNIILDLCGPLHQTLRILVRIG